MREINHPSLHQWLRSEITDSQQPTSPIGFLFLKLPPPPCAVLLVNITRGYPRHFNMLLRQSNVAMLWTIKGGFNEKLIYRWGIFNFQLPRLTTWGYIYPYIYIYIYPLYIYTYYISWLYPSKIPWKMVVKYGFWYGEVPISPYFSHHQIEASRPWKPSCPKRNAGRRRLRQSLSMEEP